VRRFVATYSRPSLVWNDLSILREHTKLPILGILDPDDTSEAVARGPFESNHGATRVDGAVAAMDALPGVVDAAQARIPVLFDSGIRSGAGVIKAMALGAAAVCIDCP
jgi:lactate 2-monooxygenase